MKSKLSTLALAVAAVAGSLAFPGISKASIINGCDSGAGQLTVTPATATITFTNSGVGQQFAVNTQGCLPFFSALVPTVPNGTTATIQPLNQPVDTPISVPNFITFSAPSTLAFTLTGVPSGTSQGYSPCTAVSNTCTIPGTPFILSNTGGGNSTAQFAVNGNLIDTTSPGTPSVSSVVFSAQFPVTLQQVVQTASTGQGITTSYSATIKASIPEPATLSMMGFGLLGLAAFARRRTRSSK